MAYTERTERLYQLGGLTMQHITTVFVIWLLAPTGDSFFYGIYRTMHRCHRAQQRILDHPDFHIQDGWGIIARECPPAKIGGKP